MTTFVFSFSLGVYLFNNFGISEGSCATRIPAASKDLIFSFAEPELPEMIAPACPICFPGGADCPAINATTGLVTLLRIYSAACSFAFPPISPIRTIAYVSG